jgi:hypothetical protein
MWSSKNYFNDLEDRVKELEKKLAALPKEPTMRLTTPDYLERYSWPTGAMRVIEGEKKDVPLADVIHMIAAAAGIELVLEPKKCTGGEVVAKKKRKARS